MAKKPSINKLIKAKAMKRMKALGIPLEQRRKILALSFRQLRAEYLATIGKEH